MAATLAISAGPATAAVTIGQVGDPTPSGCDSGEFIQASVTSGSSYTVPGSGTITSWTMQASALADQQFTMKIYRKVAEPATYQVVGHAGPQTLTPGGTTGNTFPASIQVRPGDLLGFRNLIDGSDCGFFPSTSDQFLYLATDLPDGASGAFDLFPATRLNIQAAFVPDNTFTRGKVKRNKNKGTATVTLNLPNPGELTGSGGGAKVAGGAVTTKAVPAGQAKLVIRAKGKKKRKLNETGKVKVKPKITYTPTGGDPGTQQLKVKLRKKL